LTPVLFLKENGSFPRAGVTQLVECDLAKVDVAGSNPVSRSNNFFQIAMTKRLVLLSTAALGFAASLCAQDYKMEPISTAPAGLPAAYSSAIATNGFRIAGPKGPACEIWFRKAVSVGAQPADNAIVFGIPQGTLLGVIRFPEKAEDRRGQQLNAGLYTLRYSDYPVDGAHQGVAPQRDFALLSPLAVDTDPNAVPSFDALVQMSTKASNSPHPAVLSLETPSATTFPALTKEGDNPDWVLSVQIGDLKIAIILLGKVAG
jgi:hypothetical protein